MNLFDRFSCVRVINLVSRPDRKTECLAEFEKHHMPMSNVAFYPAVKPTSKPANWVNYTLGCYGAYISHLTILQEFLRSGQESILVHEDDIKLVAPRSEYLDLIPENWDILYFGRCDKPVETQAYTVNGRKFGPTEGKSVGWRKLAPTESVQGLHAYAVTRRGAGILVKYLQEAGVRQDGDPAGGPQHVDGGISMARGVRDADGNPSIRAYILEPHICHFRASATDIHDNPMAKLSRVPGLGAVLGMARKIKNSLAS